jgi:hypothetical protein
VPDDMERLMGNIEKHVRAQKLATLKRWGLATCEHCGEPLETLFDRNGKNPIRVCGRCETEDRDHAEA